MAQSYPRAAILGLLAVLGIATPARSDACINEVFRQLTPVETIAGAERNVEAGRSGEAASAVRARYPQVRTLDGSAPPLARRAARIYALALVRADGDLDHAAGWARWGNLEWAIETLAELDAVRQNDPRSQADLAEARTHLSRTRADGVRVLESLDQRDLLGSANAYRALARTRRTAGDDPGVLAALRRCAAMSTDNWLCRSGDSWLD